MDKLKKKYSLSFQAVSTFAVSVIGGIICLLVLPANTASANDDQWRIVSMRVTAYCPCAKCCGAYSDGITASGHEIMPGDRFVAADSEYSFGTEMIIPGYSNSLAVEVLDRGGAIRGNKLDVFFATHDEALEWGVRYLDVKIKYSN